MLNAPHRQPEILQQKTHPLRIPSRQVVIHRDDVHAASRQSIQIQRQRRHKGLPFTRRHLRNLPVMQHHPANQLHVKMHHLPGDRLITHGQRTPRQPPRPVLHHRKRLRQNPVQIRLHLPVVIELRQLRLPLRRLLPQHTLWLRLKLLLQLVDLLNHRPKLLQLPLILRTDDLTEYPVQHGAALGECENSGNVEHAGSIRKGNRYSP